MDELEAIIEKNPSYKLLGKAKLKKITGLPMKVIDEWYNEREIGQIYAKPKNTQGYKINGPKNSFQIDIALLPQYQKTNNKIKEFLLLMEIPSRKMWAYPLENGQMETVLKAYKSFVNSVGKVVSIEGDDFFSAKSFKDFNEEHHINVFTDVAKDDHLTNHGNKLGIIDRATRTIKSYIQKYMLVHETTKWVKALPSLVELYNTTPHSSLDDKTPNEAYGDDTYIAVKFLKTKLENDIIQKDVNLDVGDRVRAVVGKNVFDKEKAPFSKEIYTIREANGKRFLLEDEKGNAVKRRYRPSELLKVAKVTERLGKVKEVAEKSHKHVTKVRNALGKSYEAASDAIEKSKESRPIRTKKKVTKLDL